MSRETSDLPGTLRRYAAERRAAAGPHPDGDVLVAYDRGELDEDRSAQVQEHLALCPECTEWLLDYRELDRPEPETAGDTVAAAWQRQRGTAWDEIQRRIGGLTGGAAEAGPPGSDPTATPAQAQPAVHGHPVVRWATTALLAAACVILAFLLWQAHNEVQPPQPTKIVSLLPAGSGLLRGVAPPDRLVVRPPGGHRLVVQLAYVGPETGGRFVAEIFPPTGEGAPWTVAVDRQSDEPFAVDLGTDPALGRYRIVLHEVVGEQSRQVATYGFRIGMAEPEEPPG